MIRISNMFGKTIKVGVAGIMNNNFKFYRQYPYYLPGPIIFSITTVMLVKK